MSARNSITRQHVTWMRWDPKALRDQISHPWMWCYTDGDGYERFYETRAEAEEGRAINEAD